VSLHFFTKVWLKFYLVLEKDWMAETGRIAWLDVVPPNVCLMFVIAAFCYL
jgi:hypothetical protein